MCGKRRVLTELRAIGPKQVCDKHLLSGISFCLSGAWVRECPRDGTTGKREQWEHVTCPEAASGAGPEGQG